MFNCKEFQYGINFGGAMKHADPTAFSPLGQKGKGAGQAGPKAIKNQAVYVPTPVLVRLQTPSFVKFQLMRLPSGATTGVIVTLQFPAG